jgi:hypothetical protein
MAAKNNYLHFPSTTMVVGPSGCGKSTALSKFLDLASTGPLKIVEKVIVVGASLESTDNREHYMYDRMCKLFPKAAAKDEIHYLYARIFNTDTIKKIQSIFNPPSAEEELRAMEPASSRAIDGDDEVSRLPKDHYESLFGKGEESMDKDLLKRPPCLLIVEDMEMHAASRHGRTGEQVDDYNLMRGFLGHRVHHYNMAVIVCKVTLSGTGGSFWVEQARQFIVPLHGIVPFRSISPIFQSKSVRSIPIHQMEQDYLNYVRESVSRGCNFLLWTTSSMMDIRQQHEDLNHLAVPFCA